VNLPNQVDEFSRALSADSDGWRIATTKAEFVASESGNRQVVDQRTIAHADQLDAGERLTITFELVRGQR
jgi:hypothetical protein